MSSAKTEATHAIRVRCRGCKHLTEIAVPAKGCDVSTIRGLALERYRLVLVDCSRCEDESGDMFAADLVSVHPYRAAKEGEA
jgi:hypothetical protein